MAPGHMTNHSSPRGVSRAGDVTALLQRARSGDRQAWDDVFDRVYGELRRRAQWVRRGRAGDTMSATALVHEAYLKLIPSADLEFHDRAHFFAVAARAMRQVLVGAARQRLAKKRGGGEWLVTLNDRDDIPAETARPERLLALDAALERLATLDPRQAAIVEYRFFAGLTVEEAAAVLGLSPPTVKRDWRAARAWIASEIERRDA
jgi:RNA polymerase sigma factor (TIGR02999 family)